MADSHKVNQPPVTVPPIGLAHSTRTNLRVFLQLLKKTYQAWDEDKATQQGAALAYYSCFSMAPLLLVATAVAGFLFGRKAAEGEIVRQIGSLIGQQSAEAVQAMIRNAWKPAKGVLATIIGTVTLLFGATGVFSQLQESLDIIWKGPNKPKRPIIWLLKERFISFAMVVAIGFLLLVSLVISAALTAFTRFLGDAVTGSVFALGLINAIVSFGGITVMFAMIYKILPEVHVAWEDVWLGAMMTALFFTIGKFFIGWYLATSTVGSTFGAAGSVILILLWVYYSAQIFLFGAEFTHVFSEHRRNITPS